MDSHIIKAIDNYIKSKESKTNFILKKLPIFEEYDKKNIKLTKTIQYLEKKIKNLNETIKKLEENISFNVIEKDNSQSSSDNNYSDYESEDNESDEETTSFLNENSSVCIKSN